MKHFAMQCRQHLFAALCLTASTVLAVGTATVPALAKAPVQTLASRISADGINSERSVLPGSLHPLARPENESGRLSAGTKLEGITMFFSRTAAQQADLLKLQADQQTPGSPLFHQWLTPEQFGVRFGLSDSDIAKVQAWLEQQGFSVDSIGRARSTIRFSGTVGQVEAAFSTEMHTYTLSYQGKTEKHIAPSTALSVPTGMAGVVLGIRNLDNFKPKPMMKRSTLPVSLQRDPVTARPSYTFNNGGTLDNFLAPGDIGVIYDVNPLLQDQKITGAGQSIVILGQSAVALTDIEAFQTASGLTINDPETVLVPGTGTSTVYQGDEGESDLDLEWSGATAPGAKIIFVYTGNSSTSSGVFDAAQYAVDNNLAPILSLSYGVCEFDLGSSNATILEQITSEAVTQGQSLLAASGDAGSTACFNSGSTDTTAQQETLNVSYPASSPYVTGIGGSEFSGDVGSTEQGTYWDSSTSSTTTAKSYIPETSWNDDSSSYGLSSTGGGVSTLFTKPTWQKGVAGIPSDGHRDVPDVSLDASNGHDPYLLCSSDTTTWETNSAGQILQSASCNNGFLDQTSGLPTLAGGTSFATPIFAGMLALINEKQNYTTGQGLINPTLYTLASNATTYSTAFHDITTGSNKCTAGSGYCGGTGTGSYAAGVGYDQVTGLGTVDLNVLANAWPASASTLIATTTTVSASSNAPAVGANVTYAIAVASATGTTVPTGTVSIKVDGTVVTTVTLSAGVASYTTSYTTAGAHVLIASYTGDTTHAASTATSTVNVAGTSSGTGTFTLAAGNITVAQGSVGTSTVTVTPASGYKGTVQFTLGTTSSALANACYTIASATVTGTANVTTTLSIDTNANNCATTGQVRKGIVRTIQVAENTSPWQSGSRPVTAAAIFAGVLMAGVLGRRSRKLRMLAGVLLLATAGFAVVGCGGSSNSSSGPSNPPKGTYALTLTGTDSTTSTITDTIPVTLTIQ